MRAFTPIFAGYGEIRGNGPALRFAPCGLRQTFTAPRHALALLTFQKKGSGPLTMPDTFLRHAW
jgi:hypothetical protein